MNEPYPQCPHCGGRLVKVENDIVSGDSDELPDTMAGKDYYFTGDKCLDCEEHIRGELRPLSD